MSDPLPRLVAALADRYLIERELGQGGMATVYLAQDLKHDRKVALKVLKPELAAVIGAERFVVEIKTTAALQHPHILPLFDSGTADGFLYYVMPFIDGETLRAKLDRETQLGIDEAVKITVAVADALDYAHRHGVIHRDIKPENILLHDGRPMVADFGIALALSAAAGGRMTETGMSLGTPHYMSPEQATAEKEISARSDVYSLGSVLYEMLTGNPPHTGASAQQIIMKIVTEEAAPVTKMRKAVPQNVADAVAKSLEKLPADRFGTAAEFATALADPGYASSAVGATRGTARAGGPAARRRLSVGVAAAAGLALAVLGLVTGWALWHPRAPEALPVVQRYAVALPDSVAFEIANGSSIAIAPDGSVFAYVSRAGLMLRYADRLDVVPVPGGRRGDGPFFSPDGQWLGFTDGRRMVKVPLAGGAAVTICDSCVGYSISWGSDDSIRYHVAPPENVNSRVLMAVSARGGRPREIARPDSSSGELFRAPILLPHSRTVLFALYTGKTSRLAALDLRTGTITRFDQAGFSPQWVDRGFVALSDADGSLIALPFDARRIRPAGAPVPIARDVLQPDPTSTQAAVSATGSIVYVLSGANSSRELTLVSRTGETTPLTAEPKAFEGPSLAPDGRRLAVGIADSKSGSRDVWVLDVAQHAWSRLTTDGISDRPIWTPDGQRLVYSSNSDLWRIAADGSGRPESLLVATGSRFPGTVAPDGRAVVFQEFGGIADGIRALAFDSAPAARVIIPAGFDESAPALSPDGHWLAYQADDAGRMEVYVRSYPLPGARVPVSVQGGTEPAWSRDGRELFYRSGDSLMVASVALSLNFAVAGRRRLFTGFFLSSRRFREYDVTPDGQHFVMIRGGAAQSSLIVVQNAFDRLAYDQRAKR